RLHAVRGAFGVPRGRRRDGRSGRSSLTSAVDSPRGDLARLAKLGFHLLADAVVFVALLLLAKLYEIVHKALEMGPPADFLGYVHEATVFLSFVVAAYFAVFHLQENLSGAAVEGRWRIPTGVALCVVSLAFAWKPWRKDLAVSAPRDGEEVAPVVYV